MLISMKGTPFFCWELLGCRRGPGDLHERNTNLAFLWLCKHKLWGMRIQKANYKPESCWRICFPVLPLPTVVHTLSATKCVCKGIWKPKHFRGAIKKTKTTTFGMWQVVKLFWYICSTVESWYGKHIGISKKKTEHPPNRRVSLAP